MGNKRSRKGSTPPPPPLPTGANDFMMNHHQSQVATTTGQIQPGGLAYINYYDQVLQHDHLAQMVVHQQKIISALTCVPPPPVGVR